MARKFPLSPAHPERLCWGCDRYCAASALECGNGSDRTQHPMEMFGDDWHLDPAWGFVQTDAAADGQTQAADSERSAASSSDEAR